jgi:molybdate transport system ATP-binding protein
MSVETLHLHVQLTASGFSLDVAEAVRLAGVTAVFGPSGSGKSTLLRCIAGFEAPAAGRIARQDDVWFDARSKLNMPPHRRPVGFMFQDTRLFTHLDVAGNLAFAEKRVRRMAPHFSYDDVVQALDLDGLLSRKVAALSGGERQRVALGRTLLSAPELLLLDEPLAALDQGRKAEILPYLQSLPRAFGIPALYVSHDIDEVAMLADRILVLSEGRVQLHDAASRVMERLDLQPAGGRYEGGVLLEGRVIGHDRRLHLTRIDAQGDELVLPLLDRVAVGGLVRLRIRARDVSLATQRPVGLSIRNILAGTLTQIDGDRETGVVLAEVQLRGSRVRARLTVAAVEELTLAPGQPVYVLIKSVSFEGAT